jgi:hypothetical protein
MGKCEKKKSWKLLQTFETMWGRASIRYKGESIGLERTEQETKRGRYLMVLQGKEVKPKSSTHEAKAARNLGSK